MNQVVDVHLDPMQVGLLALFWERAINSPDQLDMLSQSSTVRQVVYGEKKRWRVVRQDRLNQHNEEKVTRAVAYGYLATEAPFG